MIEDRGIWIVTEQTIYPTKEVTGAKADSDNGQSDDNDTTEVRRSAINGIFTGRNNLS